MQPISTLGLAINQSSRLGKLLRSVLLRGVGPILEQMEEVYIIVQLINFLLGFRYVRRQIRGVNNALVLEVFHCGDVIGEKESVQFVQLCFKFFDFNGELFGSPAHGQNYSMWIYRSK